MTRQEAINMVYEHFIIRKQPAGWTAVQGCDYLSPNGNRCAVGVLMGDDAKPLNGDASDVFHALSPDLRALGCSFLLDLQAAHDDSAGLARDNEKKFRELFLEKLEDVLEKYDLEMPF